MGAPAYAPPAAVEVRSGRERSFAIATAGAARPATPRSSRVLGSRRLRGDRSGHVTGHAPGVERERWWRSRAADFG